MSKKAAQTGLGPTVLVAIEQLFPIENRGTLDENAYKILPSSMKLLVNVLKFKPLLNWMIKSSEKSLPGIWAGMICRKSFVKDKLKQYKDDVNSILNLGSGYDTSLMAYNDNKIFEVDQTYNVSDKIKLIEKNKISLPNNYHIISIDFDQEDLSNKLASEGFSLESPNFFILEAVSQYLSDEAIQSLFKFLSRAANGSHLVFTYVRRDFIDGSNLMNWQQAYDKYVLKDKIWHFGLNPDEVEEFLLQFDWELIEDKSYEDLFDTYVRPLNRGLQSTSIERIVYARKR